LDDEITQPPNGHASRGPLSGGRLMFMWWRSLLVSACRASCRASMRAAGPRLQCFTWSASAPFSQLGCLFGPVCCG